MKTSPKKSVEFFILNFKVLPPTDDPQIYYTKLIKRFYTAHIPIEYGSDFVYRMTKLQELNKGDVYYGVISKFLRKEGFEWVKRNEEADLETPVDYAIPEDIDGRKASYEFVFIPKKHKFAFIKKGVIDQNVKRKGAPLKAMSNIISTAFNIILKDEGKEALVDIVQSDQVFDKIFSNPLKSLDLTVSYSNPGLGDDHNKTMDEYLRAAHAGKTRVVMQPDSTGEIDIDATFTRGLIDLARENGKIKARIQTEDGIEEINTIEHPEIGIATIKVIEKSSIFQKIIDAIVNLIR